MNVTRVHTDRGSHIEPALDPAWDDLTKLRWQAAVVEHDTGIKIRIHPGGLFTTDVFGRRIPVPNVYGMSVGSSGLSPRSYADAWTFLNGVDVGATQARNLQETP